MAKAAADDPAVFHFVMIKPSHYDDDGYVIRWWRSVIPSNSLAAVFGIAERRGLEFEFPQQARGVDAEPGEHGRERHDGRDAHLGGTGARMLRTESTAGRTVI